ncbi:hypothetical protein ElyMa_000350800 [Elysia marginata]|uniref:Uncharacterized protein n=1 Tax=Elysia marginata TaxID=1093978 RepID=A0AAV4FD34_9GAST|nr:hypothetical protein ElyMa_000350800 [Elysia marginata]
MTSDEIRDAQDILVEIICRLTKPKVVIHWYITCDKFMVHGSALEVKSFLDVFIDSLTSFDIEQSFTTIINDQISNTSNSILDSASLPCGDCMPSNLEQIEPSTIDINNSELQYTLDDQHLQSITDVMDNSLSGSPTYILQSDFEKFKTSIMADMLILKNRVRELEEKIHRKSSASLDLSYNGAPRRQFYAGFAKLNKMGTRTLVKNIKWRRDGSPLLNYSSKSFDVQNKTTSSAFSPQIKIISSVPEPKIPKAKTTELSGDLREALVNILNRLLID